MSAAAVSHAPPRRVAGAGKGLSAPKPPRLCPECLTRVSGNPPRKFFCCTAHKLAFNNRWGKRGKVLALIEAAARETRDGTRGPADLREVGRKAAADARLLMQEWKAEDARANDGRGRMSALEYMALRYRHGLVEVLR